MNILWQPDDAKSSRMLAFLVLANEKHGLKMKGYADLYSWSVNALEDFWSLCWDYFNIIGHKGNAILKEGQSIPEAAWFPESRLNFALNILRRRDESPAIIARLEGMEERILSFQELYQEVARIQQGLRSAGLKPGDVVAGFMPNIPETVIAMLAVTAMGCIWSSSSPDFGAQGVVDRFGQIKPRLLFIADGYIFKGKKVETLDKARSIIEKIPGIGSIVSVPLVGSSEPMIGGSIAWDQFGDKKASEVHFEELSFNHPVYIMYSSGTTGLPKCMVQGPGVLLNHLKEHILHGDMQAGDRIFYYTTCGWMMWNWLVSALATGAAILLFDGNPFTPEPEDLWDWTDRHRCKIFGTSARYLMALRDQNFQPGARLEHLKAILSTGSPLPEEGFVYASSLKKGVRVSSISGGTDLNGCFALGNPILPVVAGELQGRGLGMAVDVLDEAGQSVVNQKGELVCKRPFPSQPLYFWNDTTGQKYHDAYFNRFPGIWRHGDYALLTERGSMVVFGRSDATLNPGGVRIGTADIYAIVEALPEVEDSVVVGQTQGSDERIILFIKLASGCSLTEELQSRIRKVLKENASPRHVPAVIRQTPAIPYTLNMKKVELAVRNAIEGRAILNRDALANPECLAFYESVALD